MWIQLSLRMCCIGQKQLTLDQNSPNPKRDQLTHKQPKSHAICQNFKNLTQYCCRGFQVECFDFLKKDLDDK